MRFHPSRTPSMFARLCKLADRVGKELGVSITFQKGHNSRVKVILDDAPQTLMITQAEAREWLLQYQEDHNA